MFAIETLRGIVIKILEQEDLSSYSFQKELIRPFETIFVSNLARDVQELVYFYLYSRLYFFCLTFGSDNQQFLSNNFGTRK